MGHLFSKLLNIKEYARYARELPDYVRGTARAKTVWGDSIRVPFPEFRSVVERGYIVGHGEEAVLDYLQTHLCDKDIFFDVGANAGFYTLLGAHKGAKTYAFEPFPSTFQLLQENVKGKDVQLFPYAVSDSSGERGMVAGANPGLNKVSDGGAVKVTSIALDEFDIVPTIMKVDVENHEMQVFKGAQRLISAHYPTIVAEVSDESKSYLESLGYSATLLGKTNYLFTRPI